MLSSRLEQIAEAHSQQITAVIFSSRAELSFAHEQSGLDFGEPVSALLMNIVQHLPAEIGFLIRMRGLTSNDVLSQGLSLRTARVSGQILLGCSVVRGPLEPPPYADLPVVIFPDNVGADGVLTTVYRP